MSKSIITVFCIFFCVPSVYSQNISVNIYGTVADSATREVLSHATVQLMRINDTVVIRRTVNGENGFVIRKVTPGTYTLHISCVGYQDTAIRIVVQHKDTVYNAGMLLLRQSANMLKEVVVQSTLPAVIVKNETASGFKPETF